MTGSIVDQALQAGSKNSDKIWREQIRRVEKNAVFSNIISIFIAALLAAMLWQEAVYHPVKIWLAYMLVIACMRVLMDIMRSQDGYGLLKYKVSSWCYLLLILMSGIGWGGAGYLLFPADQVEQLVFVFVLVAISAGAVPVLTPVVKLYNLYLIFVLAPVIVCFLQMGETYTVVALAISGYLAILLMSGALINKNIMSALDLRFNNATLIKFMSQARNESENLNEELEAEIEQRKRIEKELQKARQTAETASKTKSEFLANMSHEIRTPMNGILGTLQLLRGSKLDTEQSEYVSIAYNSGEALLCILNDILDFSKIEAGKLELEFIPFDLKNLIKELSVLLKQKADEKAVQLKLDLDADLPSIIKGDSVRIRQILMNLMTNAIKFTEKGAVTIKIRLLEKTEKSIRLRMEVNDTGIGIPEMAQKKLFNSFTQADGTTTRKYGGTGLGLTIVRQLVTMMRGRLGIDSKEGEGSSFWVEISFETLSEHPGEGVLQDKIGSKIESKIKPDENLQGHVLLVEDNPVNQIVATKMLEKAGLTFEIANNGEEAMEALKKSHEFNLVLMDCQMPVMDGYVATQTLREYEEEKKCTRLPVIAMTANAMEGDKEKCLAAGMDDYVAKPVRQQALKEALARWL
ncbi:BarA sensory histidine kinase (= VarS = GacS) [hydrothermal vent metagenome]|uniref:histidine kinase n=1 Tax=hydrothermal vent metagenome TaxID=652676 RepID=A0A3B0YQL8_9ZZZZ